MGKNTNQGYRQGTVLDRTQLYNPKTKKYIKRGDDGKFMSGKDTPYKNVRREKNAKQVEAKPTEK